MLKPEDKYGLLPEVPEHVADDVLKEVDNFTVFLRHDFEGAVRSVMDDINWLKEKKDFLGRAVEASVDAALDLYGEKLSHKDWMNLRTILLKGTLLKLQSINNALKEKL